MYYQNRAPRKRTRDYFMPFFIIIIIIAIIFFGWRTLNQVFIDDNRTTFSEKVFLSIENGSAKAMTVGNGDWDNAPDNIYLYKGEKLKTGSDGRVSLTFTDKSIVRLDNNTQIDLVQLSKKNDANVIEVSLVNGQIWSQIERIFHPDSRFTISTDLIAVDTKGGDIAVEAPGTVYVLDGTAQVSVKFEDEIIKTINVGVGQQLVIDSDTIASINEGTEPDLIFALSESFKSSEWYRWNTKKDGAINAFEESDNEDAETDETETTDEDNETEQASTDEETSINPDRMVSITKPSSNSATSSSEISIEGVYDSEKVQAVYIDGKKASLLEKNKWKISKLTLVTEGENKLKVEAEDLSGAKVQLDSFIITYDKTPPAVPVITNPGANDETVTIDDVEQMIEGTVSGDTYVVIVNDYRLSKYVPGSKEFSYYAKTAYGNLEVGENEYEVIAEDKAGNKSESAKIILVLEQDTVDEAGGDEEVTEEDDSSVTSATETPVPVATSTGGVTITEPNGGESFTTSETEFDIKGTVPAGTETVEVNDYKLSLYEAGDSTFRYSAKASFKNLTIGEKNEYVVKAYDESGKVLGSASITIDVESGSAAAPTITMPSSSASYTTSLNEVVLGGDVGKWTDKVYVNGEKLTDYIPGSEQWRKTVTLNPGENTFTVKGEMDGVQTSSVSITITYTQ
ncbi:FecR domain-containing protein [Candidatus Peregrinibacteria bacterium]|nr:FecR domain-containing protein [Candidatus Peregrinibacteria bacterium]